MGRRDTATLKQLIEGVEQQYKPDYYCSDDWPAYQKAVPEGKHATGKDKTYRIEQHNSDTRHYAARLHRRTKVVTHSLERLKQSVLAIEYVHKQGGFQALQQQYLCIFDHSR